MQGDMDYNVLQAVCCINWELRCVAWWSSWYDVHLGRSFHYTSTSSLHRVAGPRSSDAADVAAGFPPEIPQLRHGFVGGPRHHSLQRGGRADGHVHSAGSPPETGEGRGRRRCAVLCATDETSSLQHDSDAGVCPGTFPGKFFIARD